LLEEALVNLLDNAARFSPTGGLTHQQILKEVWGPAHSADTHYLRVLIGHLRQKLGDEPSRPRFILTEQGVG